MRLGPASSTRLATFLLAAALGLAGRANAHPALEARIAELTRRIGARPGDASLLVQRAGVHREHQDWAAARKDIAAARAIDPGLPGLDLETGLLLEEEGDCASAIGMFDAALAAKPGDAATLAARGRCHAATGHADLAAADLGAAIAAVPPPARPQPDLYVERARLLLSLAPRPRLEEALATLDAGISRLGAIPTLVKSALEIETRLGRHDAALARLDAAALPPAEKLVLRGEVLHAAGREAEARAAFDDARASLAQPGRRHTPLDAELAARLAKAGAP